MALGGADFDARAAEVWADLGMPAALLGQDTTTLSGGQAARASLASILLSRFDVLLLDEPTNDLDFDGLDRLEAFVAGRAEPLVVVSHDRAFLERAITESSRSTSTRTGPRATPAAGSPTWRSGPPPAATPRRPTASSGPPSGT